MPETFVPLVSARNQKGESPFNTLKAALPAASVPTAKSAASLTEAPVVCDPKPVITLQRTGEIVTGIRVTCGCGQVIDLACVY
jgi:hypothetical protein